MDRGILRLAAIIAPGVSSVTGQVELRVADETLRIEITVPPGPTPVEPLLPVFNGLTNRLVEMAEASEAAAGRTVSCRAGCGACCRQGVPVSPSEARAIAALVAAMAEPRRTAVTARFAAARERLNAALPNRLAGQAVEGEMTAIQAFGTRYFALGIACPFLEDESCSIHPDRPTRCREYLVTSPAVYCASVTSGKIRGVPLAGKVSRALAAVEAEREGEVWLLMTDALDWAAAHPAPPSDAIGPALVQAVFARLGD